MTLRLKYANSRRNTSLACFSIRVFLMQEASFPFESTIFYLWEQLLLLQNHCQCQQILFVSGDQYANITTDQLSRISSIQSWKLA